MKKIYIKTTESCQLNCRHCYIGDYRSNEIFFDENKTIDWVKRYIDVYKINEKDIIFSFHGGEPFLCDLYKMQKVVDSFPNSIFDATSNLIWHLDEERLNFISKNFNNSHDTGKPFIKTSWDYKIRFRNVGDYELWKYNVNRLLRNSIEVKVIICLTNILLENVSPINLSEFIKSININYIEFERLTENTTYNKSLIPDYHTADEWLLDFYQINNNEIKVDLFQSFISAACGNIEGCAERKCMENVITINADGSIGGCPNTSLSYSFSNINIDPIELLKNEDRRKLIKIEETKNSHCYYCKLLPYCNGDCHQLSWQNDNCPAPKKLIRRLIDDLERKT
jgi:radical SAM protein with 4Fe4S-binding SPASM domain